MNNIAFIDGQNLHMGTLSAENPWKINFARFRIYLKEKYKISNAYFYIGYEMQENKELYQKIKNAGFILQFRKHNTLMKSKKKGNVDSDIIFDSMKKMYYQEKFDKILLVSGDGDYKMLVDFLIKENKFGSILFPNWKFASSLYKQMNPKWISDLGKNSIRKKIEAQKNEGSP